MGLIGVRMFFLVIFYISFRVFRPPGLSFGYTVFYQAYVSEGLVFLLLQPIQFRDGFLFG